jgi:hypothetical protein
MWFQRYNIVACRAVAMQRYTRAVSGQRLGKHVLASRQQIVNNATVGQTVEELCLLCGPC